MTGIIPATHDRRARQLNWNDYGGPKPILPRMETGSVSVSGETSAPLISRPVTWGQEPRRPGQSPGSGETLQALFPGRLAPSQVGVCLLREPGPSPRSSAPVGNAARSLKSNPSPGHALGEVVVLFIRGSAGAATHSHASVDLRKTPPLALCLHPPAKILCRFHKLWGGRRVEKGAGAKRWFPL